MVEDQPKRPSSAGAIDTQNQPVAPARSSLAQFPRIQTGS